MDEKFKLAGNRRMCGIANDVSRPIVLNDMHDEYTIVLKYVPTYLPSYFITSDSKQPGQTTVVIHYCSLSRVF